MAKKAEGAEKAANTKPLSQAAAIAVSKSVKEAAYKTATAELKAGSYNVDVTVRISGSYNVGEPYTQRVVAKADPWGLFAVALQELERISEASGMTGIDINKLVELAEKVDPKMIDKVTASAAETIGKIKAATSKTCEGKVTTSLKVEVIKEEVSVEPEKK